MCKRKINHLDDYKTAYCVGATYHLDLLRKTVIWFGFRIEISKMEISRDLKAVFTNT